MCADYASGMSDKYKPLKSPIDPLDESQLIYAESLVVSVPVRQNYCCLSIRNINHLKEVGGKAYEFSQTWSCFY